MPANAKIQEEAKLHSLLITQVSFNLASLENLLIWKKLMVYISFLLISIIVSHPRLLSLRETMASFGYYSLKTADGR